MQSQGLNALPTTIADFNKRQDDSWNAGEGCGNAWKFYGKMPVYIIG